MTERPVPSEFDAPFLAAKVRMPTPVGTAVGRARLRSLLDDGAGTELTVVSGPAGSGKTMLLVDWLSSNGGHPWSWLTLDDRDNDPVNFWSGLLASLSVGGLRETEADLVELADRVRDEPSRLVDAIGQALPTASAPPVLVLDDYHSIVDEQIHDGVRLAARYLHDRLRIVLATRTTPPLSLGRLRSHGRLCDVRFDDLRFTPEESHELFERLGVPTAPHDDASELIRSTEGWAVALYVAAVSERRRRERGDSGGPDSTRRHLSEYLVEEVLANESAEHGEFLLMTSVLDPLTVDRCNAVTSRADAATTLPELERSTQFVRRQDADGRWFRCHSLLRELLLAEAERRGFDLAELRLRVARIAIEEGDVAAAIDASLDAGHHAQAAELIGGAWIDHTNRGRFGTVMTWVERWSAIVDASIPDSDPAVPIVGAWAALHTGRLDDVERWLGRAEATRVDGALADGSASLRSAVAIARNSHRRRIGDVGAALLSADEAVAEETASDTAWHAVALVGRGATRYWAGDTAGAETDLTKAIAVAERAGLNVPQVMGKGYLALLALTHGDSAKARALADDGIARAEQHRLASYDQAAAATLARASAQIADMDIDGAQASLDEAERLADAGSERLLLIAIHLARADAAFLRSDTAAFTDALRSADGLRAGCPDPGMLGDAVDRALSRRRSATSPDRLTDRESVVLRFLASDLSLPDIARELGVSHNTVKSQAASIRTKLGATTRAEAVAIARESGLLR